MHYAPDTVQRRWSSPLGAARLAATPRGLAGFWFEHQRHWPAALLDGPPPLAEHPCAHPVLDAAEQQLAEYFAGRRDHFTVPLELPRATPFQHAVWQALRAVPHGRTSSYGALAERIGRPAAVRAVGAAVGRNPVSIIVPCHRVLGSGGGLTGYAGGLERKAALLALEGAQAARAIA
ncbi:methylated-DNA--[protein]-cysteine S-methyltransferase [Xylophilus sp. ASV27]|uniref:methylated-DNA--[protein]-cysteine S-methyltransferase n=1 Tax=Xylophilus sp. ASV27 TaxID=2795129 RepID=UPI0018EBAB9F|nr:methylated-DNA--[protein]-cysteine S-methyltransferase [Xylophilus sp. ASV27]